ncbi:MAG TPA: peptidyl-prolyl cis-trans isomerase [Burkholderiales bacterium]|nr:peptidyl-prolyl cis-trans isomerase [Burkholderiales bacterium]
MNPSLPRLLLATALGLAVPGLVMAQAPTNPAPAPAAKSSALPSKVNGVTIPKARVDVFVKAQVAQGTPDTPELRRAVTQELIMRELMAQEATKKGLTKNPEVQAQIDLTRQTVLAAAYRQDFAKTHKPSEADIKAEYEKARVEAGDKEYKARHILVESESQAQEIIAKLKRGERFEDLASVSKDEGSKQRGGDLDWSAPAQYVKPFAEALTKLEKGKFTETPVQTRMGYHVILLEDVRPTQFPPYEEVKGRVAQAMQAQAFEKNMIELRKKAKIE